MWRASTTGTTSTTTESPRLYDFTTRGAGAATQFHLGDSDSRGRTRRHAMERRLALAHSHSPGLPRCPLAESFARPYPILILSIPSIPSTPSTHRRRPCPPQKLDSRLEQMAPLHIAVLGTTAALPLMLRPAREKQCPGGCHRARCRSRRAQKQHVVPLAWPSTRIPSQP